eukprot:503296-Amphidinium_carterae.1
MATPEQVQKLVARIQAMEARATEHGVELDDAVGDNPTTDSGSGARGEYFRHRYRRYQSAWKARSV